MSKIQCTNCEAENESTSKYCHACGYQLPVIAVAPEIQTAKKSNSKPNTKQPASTWKLIVGTVVGSVVGFSLFFAVQHFFFGSGAAIDKELMTIASELNKSAPIMIDSDTRLDNSIALPGKIFQYNYTLVNTEKSAVNVAEFKQYLTDRLVNFVKTNPQMKFARDREVTVNYNYSDKNGEFILQVKIAPEDYK